MDRPVLLIFVQVTIFTLMLAVGVGHSRRDFLSLWKQRDLLLRSLLAVLVLVPSVVALLLWAFDLPVGVATGLALLASAAGAPLTTKRVEMAGGDSNYAASLQLTLALLSIVVTPLTLLAFHAGFELASEQVRAYEVAGQVAKVQLLPVVLGLLLQRFAPDLTKRIASPVAVLANVLFLVLVLIALVPGVKKMLQLDGPSLLAIAVMVLLGLVIGHVLGGPNRDRRSSLAIGCIARNFGLALFIATLSEAHEGTVPTLLAYLIVGSVVAIPYSIASKKKMAAADQAS